MYRSHSIATYEEARQLSAAGLSDYRVAQRLGISRSTVQNWRRRDAPPRTAGSVRGDRFDVLDAERYAYLLGVYLGDGYIWRTSRHSWRLAVYCDAAYPGVIAEISEAVSACAPGSPVHHNDKNGGSAIVVCCSFQGWNRAFPQHGPGRKHERRIALAAWQRELTHEHPRALLRGLIHSDGCRATNAFTTKLPSGRIGSYSYTRYFFSNLSADIRRIFCEHCELVGVRWTQSNARNISVSHRDSVAILDSFIGPKE